MLRDARAWLSNFAALDGAPGGAALTLRLLRSDAAEAPRALAWSPGGLPLVCASVRRLRTPSSVPGWLPALSAPMVWGRHVATDGDVAPRLLENSRVAAELSRASPWAARVWRRANAAGGDAVVVSTTDATDATTDAAALLLVSSLDAENAAPVDMALAFVAYAPQVAAQRRCTSPAIRHRRRSPSRR